MRVVQVSSGDGRGGAARAALRLHLGLLGQGVDSTLLVGRRTSDAPGVVATPPPGAWSRLVGVLRHRRAWRRAGQTIFTGDRAPGRRGLPRQLPAADVLHLHWVAGFVDHPTFFRGLPSRLPLVWTLHDMNPFTGGCHFPAGCRRFEGRCGACPQLGSRREADASRRSWERKQAALAALRGRLHVAAPSRWLALEARRSPLFRDVPVTVIPNGLDTGTFRPRDRAAARRELGIPGDARVVLVAATSLGEARKGADLVLDAVRLLRPDVPALRLVSLGAASPGGPCQALGAVKDDDPLAAAYSAADVFAIPSREDNLPNTVIESMACGTPVVGSDVGGIPDMVRPEETGLLAPPGDVPALAAALRRILLDDGLRRSMAARCREVAVAEYALPVQSRRYVELYESCRAAPPSLTIPAAPRGALQTE